MAAESVFEGTVFYGLGNVLVSSLVTQKQGQGPTGEEEGDKGGPIDALLDDVRAVPWLRSGQELQGN